jgi:hypothetical protein
MALDRGLSRQVAALRVEVDPASNRLWFGTGECTGRRRWEAAFLALLATHRHDDEARACDAAELNGALAALGQQLPLNRKQVSRLLESLADVCAQRGVDFAARLRHRPRKRTVGPWWWQPQPGDRVVLRAGAAAGHAPKAAAVPPVPWAPIPAELLPLPQLAREPTPAALLAMCTLALDYQPSWEGGPYASVLTVLADAPRWRGATPEFRAMRWLQTTSSHLHTRRLAQAHASLARARRILDREPVAAAYLGLWATTIEAGLMRIDPDGQRRRLTSVRIAETLAPLPGAGAPEADRLSRLFLCAFAAIGEVQALHRALSGHARVDARRHVVQATRLFSASLFCAFTGRHFDHMMSVLAHTGSFAHALVEAGLERDVRLPLQFFALANQATHKLGLVDSTGLVAAGLGHCWLSLPEARGAFRTLARRTRWAGPRPDELAFYQRGRDEMRALGDPRYQVKALVNLLRFTREFGPVGEARRAAQELQRMFTADPGLADLLRAEGWPTG